MIARAPAFDKTRARPIVWGVSSRPFGARLVLAGFALFVGAMGYMVASSLVRRTVPTFAPTPAAALAPGARDASITLDATDGRAWRFFDFDRGAPLAPPDTAGWDLAVRRYTIIAAGGIADLGPAPLAGARAPRAGYVANVVGSDTTNPAIRRWYRYGMLTHLLEPKGHVYAVRTRDGTHALLEVVSYYCPGVRAGCLTLRYVYPAAEDGRARGER
jgi:hypothetical protein